MCSRALNYPIQEFLNGNLFNDNQLPNKISIEQLMYQSDKMKKYNQIITKEFSGLCTMIANLMNVLEIAPTPEVTKHVIRAIREMAPYAGNKNAAMKLIVDKKLVDMSGLTGKMPPFPHITILWKMGNSSPFLYHIFVAVLWVCYLIKTGTLDVSEAYVLLPISGYLKHSESSAHNPGQISNSVGLDSNVVDEFRKSFEEVSEPLFMENQPHVKVRQSIGDQPFVKCVSRPDGRRFVLVSPYLTGSSSPPIDSHFPEHLTIRDI